MAGLLVNSRRLAQARRGILYADPEGWCIARGVIRDVPVGVAPRAGHTGHALFGVLAPDRLWFVHQQLGGGSHVFGPTLGVLRLSGDTAQYEMRVGLGAVAWVGGGALFLLAIMLGAGGGVWVVTWAGVVLGAVVLQVRSERRNAPIVAAEIVRALQDAG